MNIPKFSETIEAGVKSVGISLLAYAGRGGKLHEFVDIAMACKAPYGDACMDVSEAKTGGLSTYAACFILNFCLINGTKLAFAKRCKTARVFKR